MYNLYTQNRAFQTVDAQYLKDEFVISILYLQIFF